MGKASKIILGIFVAVIAIVAVSLVLIVQNLDAIIKQVIEDVGTQTTGTAVRVSDVKFTLKEGRGEIRGLTIANPPGYQSDNLFSMSEIAVQVAPGSLTGPVIVINEVLVEGARLTAEQKGNTTNVRELLNNLESGSSEPAPASESAPVHLMMEKFAVLDSEGTLKTEQFGDKNLRLPDIRLSNIGDKSTGLTPTELSREMLRALTKQLEQAVRKYLEDLAKEAAKKEINKQLDEKIGSENREKLEGLKGLIKQN